MATRSCARHPVPLVPPGCHNMAGFCNKLGFEIPPLVALPCMPLWHPWVDLIGDTEVSDRANGDVRIGFSIYRYRNDFTCIE